MNQTLTVFSNTSGLASRITSERYTSQMNRRKMNQQTQKQQSLKKPSTAMSSFIPLSNLLRRNHKDRVKDYL